MKNKCKTNKNQQNYDTYVYALYSTYYKMIFQKLSRIRHLQKKYFWQKV